MVMLMVEMAVALARPATCDVECQVPVHRPPAGGWWPSPQGAAAPTVAHRARA